jgi:beta-xylosidase
MYQSGKRMILIILAVITVIFPLEAQYVNPLKGDIGVHDPVMIKQGSNYYVYSTGKYVQIKTSTNRINWTNRGSVFSSTPPWVTTNVPGNDGSDFWAPDISFRNGKYWLYYSASSFGSNSSGIGLATNVHLISLHQPINGPTKVWLSNQHRQAITTVLILTYLKILTGLYGSHLAHSGLVSN